MAHGATVLTPGKPESDQPVGGVLLLVVPVVLLILLAFSIGRRAGPMSGNLLITGFAGKRPERIL